MSEILVLCGFFMIYIVEEVTHMVVDRMRHRPQVAVQPASQSSTVVCMYSQTSVKVSDRYALKNIEYRLFDTFCVKSSID